MMECHISAASLPQYVSAVSRYHILHGHPSRYVGSTLTQLVRLFYPTYTQKF